MKEVHDFDIPAPEVRPKEEIIDEPPVEEDSAEDESFSQNDIVQTTRLARDHAFGYFESGRAANASYEDTQFFELQTFMGMVGCGSAQGAACFQYRQGAEYGPHHINLGKKMLARFATDDATQERVWEIVDAKFEAAYEFHGKQMDSMSRPDEFSQAAGD